MSTEQSQSHLPTGLPKIRTGIQSSSESLKKIEGNILVGKKAIADAGYFI